MGRGKRQCNVLAQTVKNLPAMQETWGSIPGSGSSPGEGNGNPLQCSGEFHGQRSLVSYSPWGHKELNMTEYLTLSLSQSSEGIQELPK